MAAEIRRAPSTRTGARRGPGDGRVARSGPRSTARPRHRHCRPDRRGHRATPASRWPTDCAQPRRRTSAERALGESRPREHRRADASLGQPRAHHLRAGAGGQRQPAAHRHRRPQPVRAFGRRDAHPLGAVAAVELRALAALVAHPGQDRSRRGHERVGQRGGELGHPRAEDERPSIVAAEQPVHLERDGQPVRGGAGQAGRARPGRPARAGRGGDGGENGHDLSTTPMPLASCPTTRY